MTAPEPQRCVRCLNAYSGPPHIMAGRKYCCASCSVGSACEHQSIRRATAVRRFDSTFKPFRQVVRHSGPYERTRRGGS